MIDLISMLIKANMHTTNERDRLSDAEVAGQLSTFIFARLFLP